MALLMSRKLAQPEITHHVYIIGYAYTCNVMLIFIISERYTMYTHRVEVIQDVGQKQWLHRSFEVDSPE